MFYKSDTKNEDEIPVQDITLTFVSVKYPRKLIQHLKKEWGYRIEEKFQGIYYIRKEKDILPMQLIVTSRVSWDDNLWLHSLTNELKEKEQIKHIVDEYKLNKSNQLYESVMDIIVKANYQKFEEARKYMCKALEELMADVIEEREKEAIDRGMEQGIEAKGIEVFHNCLNQGMSVEQARLIAGISSELVQQELQGSSKES